MTISLKSEASGKPNLDLVFDPYYEGTKPSATSLLDDSGSDIVNRYAPIVYGSQALATGLLTGQSGHADINTLFAAYGTAVYSLPINGNLYSDGVGRGTASLAFNMNSDGTYSIVNHSNMTLASGTWISAGDSNANYSCKFTETGFTNGTDPNGGYNTFTNGAPSPSVMTSNYQFSVTSSSSSISQSASNVGQLTLTIYRLGNVRSTTTITFDCEAAG